MHLLVTGGCGFIGTNFIQHMLGAHEDAVIVNLDKLTYAGNRRNLAEVERQHLGRRYHFVHGDICDQELAAQLMQRFAFDAVVNFAAESHVDRSISDPFPFVTTNVLGTQNLLEAARQAEIPRFVHISTDEVYGSLGPTGQFTEDTPLAPNSPYSASKASSDLLARAYFHTYGMPVIITRCSNNYGPFQFPEKLVPLVYVKASRGESIPVYGDGHNVRDWIYVMDHCRGVEAALLNGVPGAVYNFGGDAERTNLEVVRLILRLTGKSEDLITHVNDRPGHDRRYAMAFARSTADLGWTPQHSFEDGMARTLAWYKANEAWLDEVQSGAYRRFMDEWYKTRQA
jgi:dTDP-glucose 4,6-dehydratase